MIRSNHRSSILFFVLLLSTQLGASQTVVLPVPETEERDPFAWQNHKHFEATLKRFSVLAEKEYYSILERTIKVIDESETFFKESHASLLRSLRKTIYYWMKEDVFTQDEYCPDEMLGGYETTEESGEDAWRNAFMDGYYRCDEDVTNSESEEVDDDSDEDSWCCDNDATDSELDDSDEDSWCCDDMSDDYYEEQQDEWQRTELVRILSIFVGSMDEFTQDSIDIHAIKQFLHNHVPGGYSSFLNEKLGGSLLMAHDFSDEVHEELGVPYELLLEILEGLWFDYDWEEYDIEDSLFIAKTYKTALKDLKKGNCAGDIKRYLIESIVKLFSFNAGDFEKPLSQIMENYNRYIKQKNWLYALIEWSLYTVYRKEFIKRAPKSCLKNVATTTPALPLFSHYNKYKAVSNDIRKARVRAHTYYSKVYLHQDTRALVYKDGKGRRATLALADRLGELKRVGMSYEPYRPGSSENVFVPQLHLIVSKDGEAPQFVEVPLLAEALGLPERPLTRAVDDEVFEEYDDITYYAQVKKDYVTGKMLQGVTRKQALADLKKNTPRELVHSERVIMELLRNPEHIRTLVRQLRRLLGKGRYRIHSAVMLAYSTNSVCPCCTPTLITLMNSHEKGGFMNLLLRELVKQGYGVPVTKKKAPDWTRFRLNIFVTAKVNFFCQAHDLTEEGQHLHNSVKKAPSTSNPHTKLYRPHDELIISDVPQLADGTLDPNQRFFYEFVGKDMHAEATEDELDDEYEGIVTSSGSTVWNL